MTSHFCCFLSVSLCSVSQSAAAAALSVRSVGLRPPTRAATAATACFNLFGWHSSGCRRILSRSHTADTLGRAYGIVWVLGKLHSLAVLLSLSRSLSLSLSLLCVIDAEVMT